MSAYVHVISKQDVTKHESVAVDPATLPPLAEGSVRIKSTVISISLNNMAYARLGAVLGWWNTYPVPETLPAPYNDQEKWGIVPAWGYGKVFESKDANVPEGSLIWGYWPTSSLPTDFTFKPASEPGYLIEVSEHRKVLMSLYNFYEFRKEVESKSEEQLAWDSTVSPVWTAGYMLGEYSFPAGGKKGFNPNGLGEWPVEENDLTSAVVVSLSASTKTARGLAWSLTRRTGAGENAPLALLEATTSPDSLVSLKSSFDQKTTSYDDLSSQDTIAWIAKFKPSKVVLVNCGTPQETVRKFQDTLLASDIPITKSPYITLVSMPGTADHPDPRTSAVHMNTSGFIDIITPVLGIEPVMGDRWKSFGKWTADKAYGKLQLERGNKIEGEDGVEGAWKKVATGTLPRDKALVFKLD